MSDAIEKRAEACYRNDGLSPHASEITRLAAFARGEVERDRAEVLRIATAERQAWMDGAKKCSTRELRERMVAGADGIEAVVRLLTPAASTSPSPSAAETAPSADIKQAREFVPYEILEGAVAFVASRAQAARQEADGLREEATRYRTALAKANEELNKQAHIGLDLEGMVHDLRSKLAAAESQLASADERARREQGA